MQKFQFAAFRNGSHIFKFRKYSFEANKTVAQIRAEQDRKREQQRSNSFSSWLLYIIPGSITLALGIWQTNRYLWKVKLIEEREKLLNQEPIPFTPSFVKPNGEVDSKYLYRKVILTGTFDYEHQILVGLRSAPEAKRVTAETGKSPSSEQGFHVITPFITDSNVLVWINRGWISRKYQDQLQQLQSIKDKVTLECIIREGEIVQHGIVQQTHVSNQWYLALNPTEWISTFLQSPTVINTTYQISTVLLDLIQIKDNSTVLNQTERMAWKYIKPEDHLQFYVTPEKHIAYLITWYGIFLWIAYLAVKKQKKRMKFK